MTTSVVVGDGITAEPGGVHTELTEVADGIREQRETLRKAASITVYVQFSDMHKTSQVFTQEFPGTTKT